MSQRSRREETSWPMFLVPVGAHRRAARMRVLPTFSYRRTSVSQQTFANVMLERKFLI